MIGRSLRKLVSLLLLLLGAMFLSGVVDITPEIGAPQIDYPGFDYGLPFWPQLALHWVFLGGGGALLAALGMIAWSDEAIGGPSLRRTAFIGVSWFLITGGLRLAGFLAWGTMGPLHVQQPIFRFALTNGLISAAAITGAWFALSFVLSRSYSAPWRRGSVALVGTGAGFAAVMLAIAAATGLPLRPIIANWWPYLAILAPAAALLAALTVRAEAPKP